MKAKETFSSYASHSIEQNSSKKVVEEIAELKAELDKARNLVRLQRVRYQQLVSLFHARLQDKEEETHTDLQAKHNQLTRILRSLYILEAKLRKEQRTLKNTLNERDDFIRNQELEINKLKSELQRKTATCMCSLASNTFPHEESNKPDLISSIGIDVLKSDDTSLSSLQSDADSTTYVITSLDNYDPSWSTLHVQGASPSPDETTQNENNENACNHKIDEELQSETRKFKMKDEQTFKNNSPCMILKEVTENPTEKLNGPVLNCVKQILSQDSKENVEKEDAPVRQYPVKPPKPVLKRDSSKYETNVPKMFLQDSTLNVKPLPNNKDCKAVEDVKSRQPNKCKAEKEIQDESSIVQTVSTLLSDSPESEDDEQSEEVSPTVSQMVKKFEKLKKKKAEAKQGSVVAQPACPKSDSMAIQTNFEEFHLVDKEIDSTCEDIANDKITGEHLRTSTTLESSVEFVSTISSPGESLMSNNNAKFETFLEVTGLSQKSILTPSRILSNHRNVIKPKDVKYRSRVKAAAGLADKCSSNASNTNPTMKYWVEPYL